VEITRLLEELKGLLGSWRKTRRRVNAKYSHRRLQDLVRKESVFLGHFIQHEALLLDAGCGDGRNAFRLVDELDIRPSRMVMLDINSEHLEKVEQNIRIDKATASLFVSIRGSVFEIPCFSNTFDVAMCLGDVLSLAAGGSIENGLRDLSRVTKPGGTILFSLVTKEYLLRIAKERKLPEKVCHIEATGIYTEWNQQYGEGVFKSWGETQGLEKKLQALDLEVVKVEEVYIDYQDIPARLLIACRKPSPSCMIEPIPRN
jgi:ubiquinone/menaquinone biosynthesis C-methylase UbiE